MLWIVPASVAMGGSTTMTLMAIPKYYLIFEMEILLVLSSV
jgi:hypothetical protein